MNFKSFSTCAGLLAGTMLTLVTAPAQAASFSSFNFDTNWSGHAPKGNITLNSVAVGSNTISSSSLILVDRVENLVNQYHTNGNTGAASSERGDQASGVKAENPTANQIAKSLGNLNLNNIIDTEDQGAFSMVVRLQRSADHFFFWERGMNSRLKVEALDDLGNTIATAVLDSKKSQYAGFDIDTTEIGENQPVGFLGLSLTSGNTNRLRLTSLSSYNGPDFKVAAASVPEPATLAGLGLVAGAIATSRRRKSAKQA